MKNVNSIRNSHKFVFMSFFLIRYASFLVLSCLETTTNFSLVLIMKFLLVAFCWLVGYMVGLLFWLLVLLTSRPVFLCYFLSFVIRFRSLKESHRCRRHDLVFSYCCLCCCFIFVTTFSCRLLTGCRWYGCQLTQERYFELLLQ